MVESYSWHLSLNLQGAPGTTFEKEIAVFGVKGRYADANTSWPTHGLLPYADCDVAGELEDTTAYQIVWEHYTKDTGPGTHGATQAVIKDAADAALAYWTAVKASCNNQFQLSEIRFQMNDRLGKSVGGSNKFILKAPLKGAQTQALPPNFAIAVSTMSQSPTRKGHGRWFLPAIGQSVMAATGIIGSTGKTNIATQSTDFLEALKNTNQLVPAVVRQVDRTFWDITGVRVGDEVDVQNKRRNARAEQYTTSTM